MARAVLDLVAKADTDLKGLRDRALRRLGYRKEEVTAHGFRTTASTLLNEMGRWNRDAIER
jgi:integrase